MGYSIMFHYKIKLPAYYSGQLTSIQLALVWSHMRLNTMLATTHKIIIQLTTTKIKLNSVA
jgi:hypothetical protein